MSFHGGTDLVPPVRAGGPAGGAGFCQGGCAGGSTSSPRARPTPCSIDERAAGADLVHAVAA